MTSKFRSRCWDPILIVSQIISMQFLFYTCLLVINYIVNESVNIMSSSDRMNYTLDQIFDHRLISFNDHRSAFLCLTFFSNSISSSFFTWQIINRSKQCLDFTVTVFAYHIIISWIYVGKFPTSLVFWLIVILSAATMTIISEYLCMKSALKEIPLSLAPKTNL